MGGTGSACGDRKNLLTVIQQFSRYVLVCSAGVDDWLDSLIPLN